MTGAREAHSLSSMTALVIDVRPARVADAAAISEVHDAAWREAYQGIIPALALARMIERRGPAWWARALARTTVLVLRADNRVVGYASLGLARQSQDGAVMGLINEFYLMPEYQGVGLGKRLFKEALATFRRLGHERAVLRVLAENERAIAFYKRLGGKRLGEAKEEIGGVSLPISWFGWTL